MSPDSPATEIDDLLERAERALAAGDDALAAGLCTQALHADRDRPQTAALLSRICFARGREDAALLALDGVEGTWLLDYLHRLSGGDAQLAGFGAFVAEAHDQLPLARELAMRAATFDPTSVTAHVLLARSERRLGDLVASFRALQHLGNLTTTHTAVRREVARWLAASGKLDHALEHYESLLRIHPGDTLSRLERWKLRDRLGLNTQYRSECGQDEYVHTTFFYAKRGGTFLDLGAGDGITGNNTWYFERELGWQGLCVTPEPQSGEVVGENRSCRWVTRSIGRMPVYPQASAELAIATAGADLEKARAVWSELLDSATFSRVDYCSVSLPDSEFVVGSLPLNQLNIAVFSVQQASERLGQVLRQAGYTHDLTIGDEVWYHPQRARKGARGNIVSTRA